MFKNIIFKKNKANSYHQAISLLDFALAEYSSAIEMLHAAKLSDNDNITKGFINHSLDEYKHTSFFLNCLNTCLKSNDFEKHIKFDSKTLYFHGFLNEKQFLYEKFNLVKFSTFVAINEKQALNLFQNIRKSNFLKDLNDLGELNKIIEEEKKHLNEMNKDTFIKAYDDLLIDEKKHVKLSSIFSKNNSNQFKRYIWNISFWVSNKFRHFISRNKFINATFNYIISMIIILLSYPLKNSLKINDKSLGKIDFSIEKSRYIL